MNMVRQTPLCFTAQRLGARFVELAGWRFPEVFTTVEAEIAAARARCGLADVTPHGKLLIEGDGADKLLHSAFGAGPEAIGSHVPIDVGGLYRLRRDQFYLSTPPGRETEAQQRLALGIAELNLFVTVTDVTHGLADIRLIGPASREVLSKVCALDFQPQAFPDRTAKQSGLARTRQLIIRRDFGDLPAYLIIGARSLGAYVWDVIFEAGREFRIVPIGVAALRELEGVLRT